jgi:Rrf2 family protein
LIYSKTSEYAVRILAYFAKEGLKTPVTIRVVSVGSGTPLAYTAKILQFLAEQRFLKSTSGSAGGYVLLRDPKKITVYEVIAAVDNFPKCKFAECIMGFKQCNDKNPCVLHDTWMDAKARIMKILSKTSVDDLARQGPSFGQGGPGKRLLSSQMRNIFYHA